MVKQLNLHRPHFQYVPSFPNWSLTSLVEWFLMCTLFQVSSFSFGSFGATHCHLWIISSVTMYRSNGHLSRVTGGVPLDQACRNKTSKVDNCTPQNNHKASPANNDANYGKARTFPKHLTGGTHLWSLKTKKSLRSCKAELRKIVLNSQNTELSLHIN